MVASLDVYVDVRTSLGVVGTVLKYMAAAPLAPLLVAILYGEPLAPFVVTAAAYLGVGAGLERLRADAEVGHREAFLVVSLSWLLIPVVGTLPYLVAGQGTVADPVNALFESMSGFTTTGSTLLGSISIPVHGHAVLLWRQLTQWLGGMGILVLMVAVLPELSVGGAQIIDQESPGLSIEKLTPRVQQTARALWSIYVGLTVVAALVYYGLHAAGMAPNMDLYNAVAHALTTMPTGGFSPEARSIEAFTPAVQWAVMPFMLLAGTNFALFWYVLRGKPGQLTHNGEFRSYLLAVGVVTVVVTALLYLGPGLAETPTEVLPIPGSVERSARQGLFQVLAVVTTTGYASMDFNTWSEPAKLVLLFAMFLGGSAGSAAGSVKIVRWYVVVKSMGRSLFTSVHPEAVRPIRINGGVLDEETVRDVFAFTLLFLSLFVVSTVLIYLDTLVTPGLSLTALEATSATIATLGNVGPGFGAVGPMNSFLDFSPRTKLFMVFLMWIGRLEVFSVVVILTPSYWRP
jgi:trk system potassium uptake protein TrkH